MAKNIPGPGRGAFIDAKLLFANPGKPVTRQRRSLGAVVMEYWSVGNYSLKCFSIITPVLQLHLVCRKTSVE